MRSGIDFELQKYRSLGGVAHPNWPRVSGSYCAFLSYFDFISAYFELILLAPELLFYLIFDFLTPQLIFGATPSSRGRISLFSSQHAIILYYRLIIRCTLFPKAIFLSLMRFLVFCGF